MNQDQQEDNLSVLIRRGGVYHGIPGNSPREILTSIIKTAALPPELNRDRLLEASLEREALMTTAIGNGIALPHPRNPVISDPEEQLTLIAFLNSPVDWHSLDNQKVHTVILIVSASAKLHLHTLSRINFFCRQPPFYTLLQNRAPLEEIAAFVKKTEQTWD